jgi:hypothetical protein
MKMSNEIECDRPETEVIEFFSYALNRGVSIEANTADICKEQFTCYETERKMIKFKTIAYFDRDMFDRKVTEYLNDGWKLEGGVSMTFNSSSRNYEYVIAVTKEHE